MHSSWDFSQMNMIRVSNIMGIDPKPFDPKTYVEEDVFVTDESGTKKRIRLENNIVRWRNVKKADGTISVCETSLFFTRIDTFTSYFIVQYVTFVLVTFY